MVVTSLLKFKTNFSFCSRKPLPCAGVFCLLLLLLVTSCSSVIIPLGSTKKKNLGGGYENLSTKDYEDHLVSLKKSFLSNPEIKVLRSNPEISNYLETLILDILSNNEMFFKKLKTGKVTIIDSDSPLHFSLPKGEIFISRGLISKYIKNESMLACVLSFELIKSEKILYPKQTIIPTGFLSLERMLSLNRLSLNEKMEVHKWAHHITVRSGFDGEYYLSWLQVQNRNTADFFLQVGDANQLTREESLFKGFMIKESSEEQVISRKNSTKNFYSFINRIRETI